MPTILVVDDEPAVLNSVALALRGQGYRILPAMSAKAALAICKAEEEIDLLISDIQMPGMGQLLTLFVPGFGNTLTGPVSCCQGAPAGGWSEGEFSDVFRQVNDARCQPEYRRIQAS
jgi:hypothetical protein